MHTDNRCGCDGSKGLRQGSQSLGTHPSGQSILLEGWKQMRSQPGHTRPGSLAVELMLLGCGGTWVEGSYLPWAQEYPNWGFSHSALWPLDEVVHVPEPAPQAKQG